MPRLICFCGVGGTGKTTVAQTLLARHPSFLFKPSIVREFYASQGVTTEGAYLAMPPKERFRFQLNLLRYYIDSTKEAMKALDTYDVLVMDRSAHDHTAYCIYGYPDMSQAELTEVLEIGKESQRRLRPQLVYFPFPVPWQDAIADGFRATGVGKNYALAAIMKNITREYGALELPISSVDERVRLIEMGLVV